MSLYKQNLNINKNKGMSYIELIVVLSIFSVLSSVVIYNYGAFQSQVDIKSLSSDVALKIVEAQKSSLSGKLPTATPSDPQSWKPSYGVYFNVKNVKPKDPLSDNKSFTYFVDLDQNRMLADCTIAVAERGGVDEKGNALGGEGVLKDGEGNNLSGGNTECLEKVSITKNNTISKLEVFYQNGSSDELTNTGDLNITFSRPSSMALFYSNGIELTDVSYVRITISSPGNSHIATVDVYGSGRIQVN